MNFFLLSFLPCRLLSGAHEIFGFNYAIASPFKQHFDHTLQHQSSSSVLTWSSLYSTNGGHFGWLSDPDMCANVWMTASGAFRRLLVGRCFITVAKYCLPCLFNTKGFLLLICRYIPNGNYFKNFPRLASHSVQRYFPAPYHTLQLLFLL